MGSTAAAQPEVLCKRKAAGTATPTRQLALRAAARRPRPRTHADLPAVVCVQPRQPHAEREAHARRRLAAPPHLQVALDLQEQRQGTSGRGACMEPSSCSLAGPHKQLGHSGQALTSAGTCPFTQPGGSGSLLVPHKLMNTFWPCSLAVLMTNLQRA